MSRESPAPASTAAEIAPFPAVLDSAPGPPAAPRPSWLRKLLPTVAERPRAATSDQTSDPLMAFVSEDEPARRTSTRPAVDAPEAGASAEPRRRVNWIHIAFVVLGIVAVAQGALIALWARSGRAAAAPDTGSLSVTSAPSGAEVSVDGTVRGSTPFRLSLAPGSHRVQVGAGTDARTQTVDVARGSDASVHVELRPAVVPPAAPAPTGGLQITTDPPGARVSVDGAPQGAAPILVRDLQPGSHTVTVTSPTGSVNRKVTVQEGAVSSLIVSLTAPAEFASGWLSITSPVTAQISEKGTLLGTTDIPRIMVPAGRHDLELTNTALGYRSQRTVQITAGKTTTVAIEVPTGTLHVNALPWAEVWIDGKRAGETPIGNFAVPIGTHEIVFRHPELGEQKKSVVVTAGAPARVGVDLRK